MNNDTIEAEVVDEKDYKKQATSAASGCACSSCCMTGCLMPILIIVLIWIGCSLKSIATKKEQPKQPATEQVEPCNNQ
jgi:hypothetical protein